MNKKINLRNELPDKLSEGTKVTYCRFEKDNYVPIEHGIIKTIRDDDYAFVVFHCDDKWDEYWNYTAQLTPIGRLIRGWIQL